MRLSSGGKTPVTVPGRYPSGLERKFWIHRQLCADEEISYDADGSGALR